VLVSRQDAILGGGSRRPAPPSTGSSRGERGAAAVEAALFLTVVLLPMVLGVITYGSYFWQAQKVAPLSARLPLDDVVGEYDCAQLIDRVKTTVQNALPNVSGAIGGVLPLEDIGVTVVNVLPSVGVDIALSISVPAVGQLGGLLPLPNGGNLLSEATYRLDNVKLTTAGC
jgi:hypothetical protein